VRYAPPCDVVLKGWRWKQHLRVASREEAHGKPGQVLRQSAGVEQVSDEALFGCLLAGQVHVVHGLQTATETENRVHLAMYLGYLMWRYEEEIQLRL
jgi:hypothetical protein